MAVAKKLLHLRAINFPESAWVREQHQCKSFLRKRHNLVYVRGFGIKRFLCATATMFEMRCTSAFSTRSPKSVNR